MTSTKKETSNPILRAVKGFLPYFATPAMLVFLIWYVATYKAEQEAQQKSVKVLMFKDVEQRIKTKNHINTPYNEYQNLMKRDTMLTQQKELYVIFDTLNKRYKSDIEDKINRVSSRSSRDSIFTELIKEQKKNDSVQVEMQKDLEKQAAINLLILEKLTHLVPQNENGN